MINNAFLSVYRTGHLALSTYLCTFQNNRDIDRVKGALRPINAKKVIYGRVKHGKGRNNIAG